MLPNTPKTDIFYWDAILKKYKLGSFLILRRQVELINSVFVAAKHFDGKTFALS